MPDPRPRPPLGRLVAVPTRSGPPSTPATDVVGCDVGGAPCRVPVASARRRVLLLFLSSRCEGCAPFWPALADPGCLGLVEGERAVAVVRDPADEDLDDLHRLAGAGAPVVCAGGSWRTYGVQGPPFYALVDPLAGRVVTEGVAWAVEQVAADVARAGRAGGEGGGD